MKKNTQVRDAVILGCVLVILIVVAINTFKTMGGVKPPPPKAPAPQPTNTAVASADAAVSTLQWVKDNESRIASLPREVEGGRNPFHDLRMAAVPPTGKDPLHIEPTSSEGPGGTLPGPDEYLVEAQVTKSRPLAWVSLAAVKEACATKNLPVDIKPGKTSGTVTISGYQEDVESALGIVTTLDVPPPVPPFILSGIVITEKTRYAAIVLDGKYYAMLQGEIVPSTGWLVHEVAPTGVTLKKGKQSVQLTLSGGTPQ